MKSDDNNEAAVNLGAAKSKPKKKLKRIVDNLIE